MCQPRPVGLASILMTSRVRLLSNILPKQIIDICFDTRQNVQIADEFVTSSVSKPTRARRRGRINVGAPIPPSSLIEQYNIMTIPWYYQCQVPSSGGWNWAPVCSTSQGLDWYPYMVRSPTRLPSVGKGTNVWYPHVSKTNNFVFKQQLFSKNNFVSKRNKMSLVSLVSK